MGQAIGKLDEIRDWLTKSTIYIYTYIVKGSLDEKLPSYEVLKMLKE